MLVMLAGCGRFESNAKLLDYRGLDGCTWVVESDGEIYEVLNLNEFVSSPEDEMRLKITYTMAEEFIGSICMVGPFIELETCEIVP